MARICKRCGKEITDFSKHRRASLCLSCRNLNMTIRGTIQVYGKIVEKMLVSLDWPNFIKTNSLIETCPSFLPELGERSNHGYRWIIAVCLINYEFSEGRRYVLRNKRSHTYMLSVSSEKNNGVNKMIQCDENVDSVECFESRSELLGKTLRILILTDYEPFVRDGIAIKLTDDSVLLRLNSGLLWINNDSIVGVVNV
jgi:hypothetical protein